MHDTLEQLEEMYSRIGTRMDEHYKAIKDLKSQRFNIEREIQSTCPHTNTTAKGMLGSYGIAYFDSCCIRCGKIVRKRIGT